MANQIGKGSSTYEGSLIISDAQLKQLLSLLNNQNESSHSKANAVTKLGLSKIASRNWIIDKGWQIILLYHLIYHIKITIAHYRPCCCLVEKEQNCCKRVFTSQFHLLSAWCVICEVGRNFDILLHWTSQQMYMRGFTCTHKKKRLITHDFLLRKKNGLLKI